MSDPHDAEPVRRVVFIGGLDDGRMAVPELLGHPRVRLVGAFVLDEEAGKKVSGFRTFDDLVAPPVLRKIKRIRDHIAEIRELAPDLVLVVGFSQIIPKALLDVPPLGVIGFHSAVLPGRRGCSPLIWAVIDGLRETGVTMFQMAEGIDTGDVIDVERFPIEPDDAAADLLRKADQATITLLRRNLTSLLDGTAPRVPQDDTQCTYTRKRGPADGEIDWSRPAQDIVNLVRALAPPYPVAHTFGGDGVPILIEKARLAPGLAVPPPRFTRTAAPYALDPDAYKDKLERFNRSARYELDLARVHRFLAELRFSSLLDLGCGTGHFLDDARARYPASVIDGVDRHDFGAKNGIVGDITREDLLAGRVYDVITMLHSINHVADLGAAMATVARLLRPGGHLVVVNPGAAYMGLWKVLDEHRLLGVPGGDPTVVSYRSRDDIARAAGERSLDPVSHETYGESLEVAWGEQRALVYSREIMIFEKRGAPAAPPEPEKAALFS